MQLYLHPRIRKCLCSRTTKQTSPSKRSEQFQSATSHTINRSVRNNSCTRICPTICSKNFSWKWALQQEVFPFPILFHGLAPDVKLVFVSVAEASMLFSERKNAPVGCLSLHEVTSSAHRDRQRDRKTHAHTRANTHRQNSDRGTQAQLTFKFADFSCKDIMSFLMATSFPW